MAIRFPRISLALVVCGAFLKPASAQSVANIVDAPFVATITHGTGEASSTALLARASNGSVYYGAYRQDGRANPSPSVIEDVPNLRRVQFSTFAPPTHVHTYRVATLKVFTESVEQHRQRLRGNQQRLRDEPEKEKGGGLYHYTLLGERPGDGMTLFGTHVEITYKDGTKRVDEYWDSDLGIRMSSTDVNPTEKKSYYVVTDIRREEPDPSLFQIPKEYLSDPLLEAKTIFIENQTGIPEVLDKVTVQFDSWKTMPKVIPLTVVKEKRAADLTAIFTKVSLAELAAIPPAVVVTPSPTFASGVEMQIHLRGSSEAEFETAAGSSGTVKGDWFAATECVVALWNRVANTRVGEEKEPDTALAKEAPGNQ